MAMAFTEQQRTFLEGKLIARLATVDENGYPHVIPLWYAVDGDDIVVMSDTKTRKVSNAHANPRGAIQIGGTPGLEEDGYLFQGDFVVEPDVNHVWAERITRRYESPARADALLDEWKQDDISVLRLKVRKIIRVY
jgi:predicted pyridoxine 5'-phosphate oxidase superfamily flavin-nucleotide-binding protein